MKHTTNISKAIILAGGSGTRLHPITKIFSKQLQPVYNKPMIYYPLSTLMLANYREILIISTPRDIVNISNLLGDGSKLGIKLHYKTQDYPRGIAESFIIGSDFIGNDNVCLILGDNIFYSHINFLLEESLKFGGGSTIFGYRVHNPNEYGVVEVDSQNNVISVQEKPVNPRSKYAILGLYLYDNSVVQFAQHLKPSKRNELEITDLNQIYLERNMLRVRLLGRGTAWFDAGTPRSLLEASTFISVIENRQGLMIGSIEEAAIQREFIKNQNEFEKMVTDIPSNEYKTYIEEVWNELHQL